MTASREGSAPPGAREGEPSGPFARVGVVGAGLMGGSLVRALRRRWPRVWIQGSSKDVRELNGAVADGILDAAFGDVGPTCGGVDLVVLAVPLAAAIDLLSTIRDAAEPECVITDLTSLKARIGDAARAAGIAERFVGGHPMAGSDRSGWAASRADLYEGRPVWLVEGGAEREARERVESMWTGIGARATWVDAETHDATMVWTSHLPQLASTALAEVLARAGIERSELGPGGRDVTRLAGSSPQIWRDLLTPPPVGEADALRALASTIEDLARAIEHGETERIAERMEQSRRWMRKEDA